MFFMLLYIFIFQLAQGLYLFLKLVHLNWSQLMHFSFRVKKTLFGDDFAPVHSKMCLSSNTRGLQSTSFKNTYKTFAD